MIDVIKFSNDIPKPNNNYFSGSLYQPNGDQNKYAYFIDYCYKKSPTNQGIIKTFSNYIYGDGLVDINGKNINKLIGKNDVRALIEDYKVQGGYALQVIWAMNKKNIAKIKYIPFKNIALKIDENTLETIGYYYCPDWENVGRFQPREYAKFSGEYKDHDVEIFVHQRFTSNLFFALPDWESGVESAYAETLMNTFMVNHIENGFQGTTLINLFAQPESDEHEEEIKNTFRHKLTGVGQANKFIINFIESPDNPPLTIDKIEPTEVNEQMKHFEESAVIKLLQAHNAPAILFSGSREGGGLGNNAEEMGEAIKSLYRSQINPNRESIIDGLNEIFFSIDPTITLEFKDFEELNTEVIEENDTTIKVTE